MTKSINTHVVMCSGNGCDGEAPLSH